MWVFILKEIICGNISKDNKRKNGHNENNHGGQGLLIEIMSIDIYTLLEPRDNTPVRKRENVCGSRDNEERLQA